MWIAGTIAVVVLFLLLIVISVRKKRKNAGQNTTANSHQNIPRSLLWIVVIALLIAVPLAAFLPRCGVSLARYLTRIHSWEAPDGPFSCVIVESRSDLTNSSTTNAVSLYLRPSDVDVLMNRLQHGAGKSWTIWEEKPQDKSGYLLHFLRVDGSGITILVNAWSLSCQGETTQFHMDSAELYAWLSSREPELWLDGDAVHSRFLTANNLTDVRLAWQESKKSTPEYEAVPESEWPAICKAIGQIQRDSGSDANYNPRPQKLSIQLNLGCIVLTIEDSPTASGDLMRIIFSSSLMNESETLLYYPGTQMYFLLEPDCHPFLPWIPETAAIRTLID